MWKQFPYFQSAVIRKTKKLDWTICEAVKLSRKKRHLIYIVFLRTTKIEESIRRLGMFFHRHQSSISLARSLVANRNQKYPRFSTPLRNFFLKVVKTWRSCNIRRLRCFNNSLYFKCDDVEQGLKQQYIESKAYNNNENEVKTSNNSLLNHHAGSSKSSVYIQRGLKAVSSLIIISLASYIAYCHMDNLFYGFLSIFIAIVTILFITGKWKWFYIAAVTTPRDLT